MRHAIRRLQEELAALREGLAEVRCDPTAFGDLGAAARLERELEVEIEETADAIDVLQSCSEPLLHFAGAPRLERAVAHV